MILEKMKLIPTNNMAAYLRKIAIDGYIVQVDHSDIKAMTAEIQKIGVNINQIARRVNSTGSVYQEDIDELKGALEEIWRLQRLSLLKALYGVPSADYFDTIHEGYASADFDTGILYDALKHSGEAAE